jgi:anthranilate synthase component 1
MKKSFFQKELNFFSDTISIYNACNKISNNIFHSETKKENISFIPLKPLFINKIDMNSKHNFKDIKKYFYKKQKEYDLFSIKNLNLKYCGGISGIFSYDYLYFFNKSIIKKDLKNTLAVWTWNDKFISIKNKTKKINICGWFKKEEEFIKYYEDTKNIIIKNRIYKNIKVKLESPFKNIYTKNEYINQFNKIQKKIEEGKSFQVNFSQKFESKTENKVLDIFSSAIKNNPAPMMGVFEWKNKNINYSCISCSPERLFSVSENNEILIQPIAGTRKKSDIKNENLELEKELTSSTKEISEHSMIVDLLRNDMGKVTKFGSVKVRDFARIEKFKTVIHLVSDIIGTLDNNKNMFDIFEAVFPSGTITGTPKEETMKILQEVEDSNRSFYCGSMGYFSLNNTADFNILIRTLEKQNKKIFGRAGGGIIYGANPNNEYNETLHKWKGLENIFEPL